MGLTKGLLVKAVVFVTVVGLLASGYLVSAWQLRVGDQEQRIKQLESSNKELKQDKLSLMSQRTKTKQDYDDLSARYFSLGNAVSRGRERDGVLTYRAELESYLRGRGSPLANHVDTFIIGENATGVSAKLVIAIAVIESLGGVRNANQYNAWGRKASGGGYQAFPSWPDAILNQFSYLQKKWNSSDPYRLKGYATDPSWPQKVSATMGQIGGREQ